MPYSNIDEKKLKKLFKKSPKEAIYYVKDITGWDIKYCSDYVYQLCDEDENKKCNPVLNVFKEIFGIIIDLLPPYY